MKNSDQHGEFARFLSALEALDIDPEKVKSTAHTSAVTARRAELQALMTEATEATTA